MAEAKCYNGKQKLSKGQEGTEYKMSDYSINRDNFSFELEKTEKEAEWFKGKTLFVDGDSITADYSYTTRLWHDYLKEWFKLRDVVNTAVSGSGLIKRNGIVHRMEETWNRDADLIAVMGNMNDGTSGKFATPAALGTFADSSEDKKDTSIYGALHYVCQKATEMHPLTPIVFIISTPREQYNAEMGKCWGIDGWFEPWTEAIKKVCGHYSIPVLDLYHESGLRPWNERHRLQYFDQNDGFGGVHLNAKGQELIARKIYVFMKQYI